MTAVKPSVVVHPTLDLGITLYKLEVFSLVVELGRVTLAADELYVAQPVVTVHLQSLEHKLGVSLFERTGRTLQLSKAGERVYRWAAETIEGLRLLIEQLEDRREGRLGTVLVGASMTLGTYRLPEILTASHQRRSRAEISLATSDPETALRDVQQGNLDFALVLRDESPDDSVLEGEVLAEEDIVLVAAPGYPVADRIALDAVPDIPFVASPAGLLRRALVNVAIKQQRSPARGAVVEYGHPEAIKQGVIDGLGVALLFRSAVAGELESGVLREIEVNDLDLKLPIYAVKRRDRQLTPLQHAVWDEIRAELRRDPADRPLASVQAPALLGAPRLQPPAAAHDREARIPFEQLDSRVSLNKLEVLCRVVELGSIGRAAEQLGLAPAVVTAHLRSLERRMRVTLFDRTINGLRTTEEGRDVHEFAALTMSRGRTMMRELRNLHGEESGTALIGASMSIGSFLLPSIVNKFVQRRPQSNITIRISDPEAAIRDVERGELDFVITIMDRPVSHPLLSYDYLGEEEMVLVTADDAEPIADEISVRDLPDVRMIGTSRGTAVRAMVDQALVSFGVALPTTVLEMGHSLPTLYAVKRGLGAALVSHSALDGFLAQSSGLRVVPFYDARITIPIYAVRQREKLLSPLEKLLLQDIRVAVNARPLIERSERSQRALAQEYEQRKTWHAGKDTPGRNPISRLDNRGMSQFTHSRRGDE